MMATTTASPPASTTDSPARRTPRSGSTTDTAGSTRPTPASTRSSRSASSCPRTRADLVAAVAIAAEEGVPILPRGGATSLSGQTIGEAIVLDLSKYLNRIGVVDRDRMSVTVEPGVVLDQLNAHLKPLGLMFGPDVSTSDRATIGGMIGNNSAGARSLRYGKTVDHVRSLDVVLDDGTEATFGPVSTGPDWTRSAPARIASAGLHRAVRDDRGEPPRRRSPPASRRSSAGSAATTSTSSSRACRSGPRAGPTSRGRSTWPG